MAATDQQTVAAILVAAGDGRRLGLDLPKAFCIVGGRTLIEHAVARFAGHRDVRDVIAVVPAARVAEATALLPGVRIVAGGSTRRHSVTAGLSGLEPDVNTVLVHDVARPFVPAQVISRVLTALRSGSQAVVPVVPIDDTVRRVDAKGAFVEVVDRSTLVAVQTPQGFDREVLERAHTRGGPTAVTDDAALVEAIGVDVSAVEGADDAFKITRPIDLEVAETVAARQ